MKEKSLVTFEIRIEGYKNHTWQGKVVTADGESAAFRSDLELQKLRELWETMQRPYRTAKPRYVGKSLLPGVSRQNNYLQTFNTDLFLHFTLFRYDHFRHIRQNKKVC